MKVKLISLLALAAFATAAHAGSGKDWFAHYDKNGDGYMTADELGPEKAHKIQKLDQDGDERVSRAEYDAYKSKKYRDKKDDTA